MQIWIFDVEHGSCACLITDAGEVVLFDCGTNTTTGFTPTQWLRDNKIGQVDHLVISHFDADHVADAHNLADSLAVRTLWRNRHQSSARIRARKGDYSGRDAGLEAALDLHEKYIYPAPQLSFPMPTYANSPSSFEDQNNLSLVAIPQIDGMTTVFPGDLEADGWDALLRTSEFRQDLNKVDFFVAPHHGRRSGFTPAIFGGGLPQPSLCIISDTSVLEANPPDYGQYAAGVRFGTQVRRVLTTRRDGNILIERQNGDLRITIGLSV